MASIIGDQKAFEQPQKISQTMEELTRTLHLILEGAISRAAADLSTKL